MSAGFEELREDFARTFRAIEENGETTRRAIEAIFTEQRALWRDQAALRDEVNEQVKALSNRIETVTCARLTEPAEVAHKIVRRDVLGGDAA